MPALGLLLPFCMNEPRKEPERPTASPDAPVSDPENVFLVSVTLVVSGSSVDDRVAPSIV